MCVHVGDKTGQEKLPGADNEELCLLGEEVRVGSRNHQIFTRVQICLFLK